MTAPALGVPPTDVPPADAPAAALASATGGARKWRTTQPYDLVGEPVFIRLAA